MTIDIEALRALFEKWNDTASVVAKDKLADAVPALLEEMTAMRAEVASWKSRAEDAWKRCDKLMNEQMLKDWPELLEARAEVERLRADPLVSTAIEAAQHMSGHLAGRYTSLVRVGAERELVHVEITRDAMWRILNENNKRGAEARAALAEAVGLLRHYVDRWGRAQDRDQATCAFLARHELKAT